MDLPANAGWPIVIQMASPLTIAVKRIHEPAGPGDGARFLVDRLWPRGGAKDNAALAAWLKQELKPLMLEELAAAKIEQSGLFRPDVVTKLIDEHLNGRRDNRKQLWTMLTYSLWRDSLKPSTA